MGIYDLRHQGSGGTNAVDSFGGVALDDNVNFKGQIISKEITVYNNVSVTGQRGYFETPTEYFVFSGAWRRTEQRQATGRSQPMRTQPNKYCWRFSALSFQSSRGEGQGIYSEQTAEHRRGFTIIEALDCRRYHVHKRCGYGQPLEFLLPHDDPGRQ